MQNAKSVTYVGDGDSEHFALVTADNGDTADLLVWKDGDGWVDLKDVPKREAGSPDGNGHTWH